MANENKTCANKVTIEGYLKENTLATMVTKTGKEAISGVLTIALNAEEDYRVRYMVCRLKKDGSENSIYTALAGLLPSNTMSIALLLKTNPTATFDEVKLQATRVYATGSFECYDRKDTKGVIHTSATIRGINAGIKKESVERPFTLKAEYGVDAYVETIKDEKDSNGDDTGRVILGLVIPDYYNKTVVPLDFVCDNESSKGQAAMLSKGNSAYFEGTLRSTRKETIIPGEKRRFLDGSEEDTSRVTYSFVNERVISRIGLIYEEGNSKCITAKEVKDFYANRQKKLDELEVTPDKSSNGGASAAPAPSAKGFEL